MGRVLNAKIRNAITFVGGIELSKRRKTLRRLMLSLWERQSSKWLLLKYVGREIEFLSKPFGTKRLAKKRERNNPERGRKKDWGRSNRRTPVAREVKGSEKVRPANTSWTTELRT